MKRLLLALITIFIIFGFIANNSSCTKQNDLAENNGPDYVGSGFSDRHNPLNPKELDKLTSEYKLKTGDPFKGKYAIDNHRSKRSTFHLAALLNYKQVPFKIDAVKTSYKRIVMPPYSKKLSKFKSSPLNKGLHVYTMLLFQALDKHKISSKFRLASHTLVYPSKANFIVGGIDNREIPFSDYERTAYMDNVKGSSIIINQNQDNPGEVWFKSSTKQSAKIRYFIHLFNDTKYQKTFALTAFLDTKQVGVQGQPVIFGKIEPKTRLVIPSSVQAPVDKKISELTVIYFGSPFHKTYKKGEKPPPDFDDRVQASIRVALIAK